MLKKITNYTKPAHEYPAIEDVLADVECTWALTFNIAGEEHWHLQETRYKALFHRLNQYVIVVAYPEFSKNMRYHYHGTFLLKDQSCIIPLYFLLNELKKDFTFCIKKMDDVAINSDKYKDWITYCKKNKSIMQPFLKKYKIKYGISLAHEKKGIEKYAINLKEDLQFGIDDM